MYRLLRSIHYYTGFILLAFVLMYFATGYVLIHSNWFDASEPEVTERSVQIGQIPDAEKIADREFLESLAGDLGLSGRGRFVRQSDSGEFRFEFNRPGYRAVVTTQANGTAHVKEETFGLARTLIGFHRFHGYWGGPLYVIWAVAYDLASLSMIVFAATGVLMWWRLTPRSRRPLGWFFLGGSFILTLSTFLYFLYRA